jgi:hypothetical protein
MNRFERSLVSLLLGGACLITACGGNGGGTPDGGAAGSTGAAGTGAAGSTGAAGTTGAAGSTGAAGTTGGAGTGAAGTGAAGSGAAGSTGAAGTGGVPSTVPLTQRTSRGTLQCTATRGRTDHSPRAWASAPALVTTTAGTSFLIRPESMPANPNVPAPTQLLASTLSAAGAFGTPTVVPSTPADVGELAAAPRGAGFAAVFVEGTALRFAAFDAAGAIVIAPKTVLTGVDTLSTTPAMAAGPDGGFGVVYAADTGGDKREVRFVTLTADGAMRGTPRTLNAAGTLVSFIAPAPTIVSDAGGYAMIWRSPTEARGGIDFAKADAAGVETVARRRISVTNTAGVVVGGSAGFDWPRHALLAVDGGYIAAWSEVSGGDLASNASSEVRIVRLNSGGVAQGVPVPVRPRATDVDEVEPVLVKLGNDAAGIMWGRGTHIYICGGCVPDHRIDLLPIHPVDLTPLGNLVSITNGAATPATKAGGLLRKRATASGTSLLVTYQLTFHVHAEPGSVAFTCGP